MRNRRSISAIAVSKKTGDYSALSYTDICVVALTYELDQQDKAKSEGPQVSLRVCSKEFVEGDQVEQERDAEVETVTESLNKSTLEEQQVETPVEAIPPEDSSMTELPPASGPSAGTDLVETKHLEPENPLPTPPSTPPLYEDPSDQDDGEGEWITPTNVALHKSKELQLIPAQGGANEKVTTGCMTTDFAMQNVLMHMGLSLVGVDGKKIDKVKTWVLRCHACFK